MLTSCEKLEEEGMNNGADFYSYRAQSTDYDYQDGAGPFDTAIRFSVERAAGRVPIIAGTGSNDTAYAVSLSQYACDVGAGCHRGNGG